MFKKASIFIYALMILGVVIFEWLALRPTSCWTAGKLLKIELSRGALTVFDFPSKKTTTSAVMIFGSGDGGWGNLEEDICQAFQDQGYEIIGIDSCAYAKSDYNLDVLQSDYAKIAQTIRARFGNHPPPLIVGGYSMGAAQAIAVSGGPHPPQGLIGLVVIDPLSRGRYGLHQLDQLDVLPIGPGTFGVDSFCRSMGSLRVVQWHAEKDNIDSSRWLDSLTAHYKFFTFLGTGHSYDTNRAGFLGQLVQSAQWIIDPMSDDSMTGKTNPKP
jgi:pimeloyl-ACP methyl ester carboxylesterase